MDICLFPSCFFPLQTQEQDWLNKRMKAFLLSKRGLTFSTMLADQCGVHNRDFVANKSPQSSALKQIHKHFSCNCFFFPWGCFTSTIPTLGSAPRNRPSQPIKFSFYQGCLEPVFIDRGLAWEIHPCFFQNTQCVNCRDVAVLSSGNTAVLNRL